MQEIHKIKQDQVVSLANISADGKDFHPDRRKAEKEFKNLRKELRELQSKLYAEDKHKLLIVFQALDAGGKDGTIRAITQGVNPQGVRVSSFKAPSKFELAHDFLWRIHKEVPAKGMIRIFNRSHYEDVLIVRVDNLVPETVWRPRYEHINNFEKLLADSGTSILKFYLHISKDEQRERFQERVDIAAKNWKFSFEDLEKRKQWADYMVAYEEMLQKTSTDHAPWFVIPANQNWYRNLAIERTIVNCLRNLSPQYPLPEGDVSGIVVE
ncbi:MAG: polyphosphate kinase 2 family protein [Candidatus Promineifilaceae bacterium]|nr:polyphosphate kinase 2 family protein [Candidatus Promineifilaceae bacterium]